MATETAEKNETETAPVRVLEIADIMAAIPHRYPFLLIDRVEVIEESVKFIGYKAVTMNEPFFQGHFPGRPIMPGVLILEALAQTGCVALLSKEEFKNKIAFFLGIDNAKFRNPVTPGHMLKLVCTVIRIGGKGGKFRAEAFVDGKKADEADMKFVLVNK